MRAVVWSLLPLSAVVLLLVLGAGGTRDTAVDPTGDGGPASPWFDPAGFTRIGPVRPGDWLARFEEKGQSFRRYRRSDPPRVTTERRVLVMQPLGEFTEDEGALMRTAARFASLYFQLPVRIAGPAPLPPKDRRTIRFLGRSVTQYRTRWIFLGQLLPRLPQDAVAFLGITVEDIYPGPDWNYVFGEAYLDRRIGVYSLARYLPRFWNEADTPQTRLRSRLRTFKVLAHETAHMFGLEHCITYECVVNGSNSLEETDRQPVHLCPECLRKLHWNRGFDIAARYRALHRFYLEQGLEAEADFVASRLARAGSD
jgi:archaemetzincin